VPILAVVGVSVGIGLDKVIDAVPILAVVGVSVGIDCDKVIDAVPMLASTAVGASLELAPERKSNDADAKDVALGDADVVPNSEPLAPSSFRVSKTTTSKSWHSAVVAAFTHSPSRAGSTLLSSMAAQTRDFSSALLSPEAASAMHVPISVNWSCRNGAITRPSLSATKLSKRCIVSFDALCIVISSPSSVREGDFVATEFTDRGRLATATPFCLSS